MRGLLTDPHLHEVVERELRERVTGAQPQILWQPSRHDRLNERERVCLVEEDNLVQTLQNRNTRRNVNFRALRLLQKLLLLVLVQPLQEALNEVGLLTQQTENYQILNPRNVHAPGLQTAERLGKRVKIDRRILA